MHNLLDLAVRIQQIPAPTFAEAERAHFVKGLFESNDLQDVSMDAAGNVYARLAGQGAGKPLVVSAHLDTVFPIETDLAVSRQPDRIAGPGIGDNSLGVAALFDLLWRLRAHGVCLPGDLWLVANVCEEGLGDLRGMRAVVERFGAQALAYLAFEGLSLGFIQHRGLDVRRYRISAQTSGGHSWADHGQPSALHELARLVTQLISIPLPEQARSTLNVGRMAGGTSVNAIASEAWLELDLRSEDTRALDGLVRQVENLVGIAASPGVRLEATLIGQRPSGALPASHPLVGLAERCLQVQGIQPKLTIGSTDANAPLSCGYPALVLGVTTGGGAHTLDEYIHTEPAARGMAQIFDFVRQAWDLAW